MTWVLGCLKWRNCCLQLASGLENKNFERSQTWPVIRLAYLGRFKCKIFSQICCILLKQENNMNMNMEKWVVFVSHWKKIEKTIAYALTMFCWTEVLPKEVWGAFELILVFQSCFSMRYIRMLCKFPGWSLLWVTIVVHDIATIFSYCIMK